jgi:hypothetical protein
LGALCFLGLRFVLQLFVYLISEGFSRFKFIAKNFLLYSAYLRTSASSPKGVVIEMNCPACVLGIGSSSLAKIDYKRR